MRFLLAALLLVLLFSTVGRADSSPGENKNVKQCQNVLSIFGQSRITDLKTVTAPTTAKVESVRAPVLGLMYQRVTDSGLVLGAGLDTEGDGLLNIGIGW